MVEFHIGTSVIAKSHDTMVCTDTASGMITIAITLMPASSERHCCAVPLQPSAARPQKRLRQPVARSRRMARSGSSGSAR